MKPIPALITDTNCCQYGLLYWDASLYQQALPYWHALQYWHAVPYWDEAELRQAQNYSCTSVRQTNHRYCRASELSRTAQCYCIPFIERLYFGFLRASYTLKPSMMESNPSTQNWSSLGLLSPHEPYSCKLFWSCEGNAIRIPGCASRGHCNYHASGWRIGFYFTTKHASESSDNGWDLSLEGRNIFHES